ncbi:putative high mobility group B protein 11 [Cornus florida]|uniref:putative high mobility group B protein 11 n=1 Tax=Cornus florida TaxID=4283 RepID=UPI0028998CA8|nr:putative high mobility group B protein 11 [Cornus florida]
MQADNEKVPAEKQINGCNGIDSSNPDADVSPLVAGENSPSQAATTMTSMEKSPSDTGCNGSDSSNPDDDVSPVVAGENSPSHAATTKTSSEKSPSDTFYERLANFFESSGLSLLFNFRETSLDLYLFYKEVTERGGFYQVTKDVKWDEVASTLKLKSSVPMLPTQLQKLYSYLLYQFEQTYFYRTPVKPIKAPGDSSGIGVNSTAKRKYGDSSDSSDSTRIDFGGGDGPMEKRKCIYYPCQLSTEPGIAEQKLSPKTPSRNYSKKEADAPPRPKTSYQIFLRKECVRLKEIHGETSGSHNIRDMAIDAWRCLSETDRQPYVEEYKKDKERFDREMTAYKERKNLQNMTAQKMPSSSRPNENSRTISFQIEGDYHVTLQQSDAENFFVADESTIDTTVRMMKNAQADDPILQINFDDYCGSLDLPN